MLSAHAETDKTGQSQLIPRATIFAAACFIRAPRFLSYPSCFTNVGHVLLGVLTSLAVIVLEFNFVRF